MQIGALMQHSRIGAVRKSIAVSLAAVSLGVAHAAEFRTPAPLKTFVYRECPLGSDYFVYVDLASGRCNWQRG
jgi:hypothetical protein